LHSTDRGTVTDTQVDTNVIHNNGAKADSSEQSYTSQSYVRVDVTGGIQSIVVAEASAQDGSTAQATANNVATATDSTVDQYAQSDAEASGDGQSVSDEHSDVYPDT
jgi:hypothetical protein